MKTFGTILALCFYLFGSYALAEPGISSKEIHLGSVLAIHGKARKLGTGMKAGLDAAFKGEMVKGKSVRISYQDDSYNPEKSVTSTRQLIKDDIFLMIGNVGTPTAKVTLPILAENSIPAVGFYTGASLLRPGPGPTINYRASYIEEVAEVIRQAMENGINPEEVCAYVQNDAFGMAGLEGFKTAFAFIPRMKNTLNTIDNIISMKGENPDRNFKGPVGVYTRGKSDVDTGYKSLKDWELKNKTKCKLIVTVGLYNSIAKFIWVANSKNLENWIISTISFTGADRLRSALSNYGASRNVVMTQVVPLLDSDLPLVKEARRKLGKKFSFVSLEGYIVGKMTVQILNNIKGPITRNSFVREARRSKFDLGGVAIDFTKDDRSVYQGSGLVSVSFLGPMTYEPVTSAHWKKMQDKRALF